MKNEDILVSIIVPCYDVDPYIERCLESVTSQTHKNIEILLVCKRKNDMDHTFHTCQIFSQKDRRIRLIEQESAGLGLGRDMALDIAQGDYICSVDGDDYVLPDYVEKLLDAAVTSNACLVQCRNSRNSHPRDEAAGTKIFYDYQEYFDYTWKHSFDEYAFTMYSFWGCLYKKSLLAGIRFGDYLVCEDQLFQLKAIHKARKFVCIQNVYYHYTLDDTSGVRRSVNLTNLDEIRVGDDIMDYLESVHSKLYDLHYGWNVDRYCRIFLTLCRDCYEEYGQFAHLKNKLYEMVEYLKYHNPDLYKSYGFHRQSLKEEFEAMKRRPYIVYGYGTLGVYIVKWFQYFHIDIPAIFDIRADNRRITERDIPFVYPCGDFKHDTPVIICLNDDGRVMEIKGALQKLGYTQFVEAGLILDCIAYGAAEKFLPRLLHLQ